MTTMTKRQQAIYNNYRSTTDRFLSDVYGSYSRAKENAMRYCEDLMRRFNGYGLRIISHNTFTFTVGFMFSDENGVVNLMYITPNKDEYFEI